MACRRTEVSVSRVAAQCGGLAGVLEGCLGPNGRAVLMEKAGCVIISQDGTELLSTLEICDPLPNMVVRAAVEQTRVIGDGCKITVILLRQLLGSLDASIPSGSSMTQVTRRQKLIQITQRLRRSILWRLQRDVINNGAQLYPLRSFEAITHILYSAAEDFFRTKFSKFIAKNLAKLFSSYLASECSSGGELLRLLDHLAVHPHSTIIEVFHMPLIRSHIISGFVITRRFRYLHKHMDFDNVPLSLWSIKLDEKREDGESKDTVYTQCGITLLESLASKSNLLNRCLLQLATLGTKVILSVPCFPDWGISMCVKYGISLVDGIDEEEWNLMMEKMKLPIITSEDDVGSKSIGILERMEPIRIGTSNYIRLRGQGGKSGHQMVLCGPTQTQCRQFSGAYVKLFKYLSSWVADSLDFYHNNTGVEPENDHQYKPYRSADQECNGSEVSEHITCSASIDNSDLNTNDHSGEPADQLCDDLKRHCALKSHYAGDLDSCGDSEQTHSFGANTFSLKKGIEGPYSHDKDSSATPAINCDYETDIGAEVVVPYDGALTSGEMLNSYQNLDDHKHRNSQENTRCINNWHINSMLNRCLYTPVPDSSKFSGGSRVASKTTYAQSPTDPRVGAVLYTIPHGGFAELLAKYLVSENMSVGVIDEKTKQILLGLLNEIPWQLHRKVQYSRKSYLEFQIKLFNHFGELRKTGQKFIQPQVMQNSHFSGYQSPFLLFKVLDCVLHFAEYILRIECIVPSKTRISKLTQNSSSDDSDED